MLEFLVIAIIIVVTLIILSRYGRKSLNNKGLGLPRQKPPEMLGIRTGHPAYPAAVRLESALRGADLENRVMERILRTHPQMKDREWDWLWFELKRFFLLSALMRKVNMYSSMVDDIWHEMLMFTREYKQFCERFCGSMIHHAPHAAQPLQAAQPEKDKDERAWFDWVYSELFEPVPASSSIWGSFYRYPLSKTMLEKLGRADKREIQAERFNMAAASAFPDMAAAVEYLIERAQSQVIAAQAHMERRERPERERHDPAVAGMFGAAMIFASLSYAPEDHASYYEYMQTMEREQQRQDGGGSSGYACSGGRQDSESGNGGDSDGGSSGCSGGGCSS
ncbi:hypothetical protein [Paenibacillus abyssi]|uniref:TIGR04222 domain-containing membrane protein n=1 Tax=Paenibacillus abyssi TaxID=1340531 RepID=A0A917FP05_9BACL|nr:hypothetical protein [Paenibacillus abyssi]GGF91941.1 hypothetical protein GCM10010916_06620 [Paenibacillus abyssi]